MAPRVICFGAANVDIQARAFEDIITGSSNPVRTSRQHGGVARNVAAWLACLGRDVSLITRLGNDANGDGILAELTKLGIDGAGISRSSTAATASYTAALHGSGELHVGLADMRIYDEISTACVDTALNAVGEAEAWFLDANLPEPVVRHLADRVPKDVLFAADTVSVAKASRLRAACPRLNILVTNTAEVSRVVPAGNPETAAARLRAQGVDHVVIGKGAKGALIAGPGGIKSQPSVAARVVDVTGAGDAMAAGWIFARLIDRPAEDAARIAMAAAALAVEGAAPSPEAIDQKALLVRAGIGL